MPAGTELRVLEVRNADALFTINEAMRFLDIEETARQVVTLENGTTYLQVSIVCSEGDLSAMQLIHDILMHRHNVNHPQLSLPPVPEDGA